MTSGQPSPVAHALAGKIRDEAEAITDAWLERLREGLGVRPRRLLPSETLRDHMPEVIEETALFLEMPAHSLPNRTVDLLRTVAQLRREQGYDIQELLTEFDLLGDLVFERVLEWSREQGDEVETAEAVRIAGRLSKALRKVSAVAVGTYREEELRHRRTLADRLADFAAMIDHEIRTPLDTIGFSAALLAEEEIAHDPERRQELADRIEDRIERLEDLVGDIRSIAVAEGARSEESWVRIGEVVQRVLEEVRSMASRYDVEVTWEPPEEEFEVDALRVEIALMNLVTNAIKFRDDEKEERRVRITAGPTPLEEMPGGRRISVEDNGLGIPRDVQSKVFQRFFRANTDVEGTGLGLEIAKLVVDQRGGSLAFESEPGEGTTFHVDIPPRLPAAEEEGTAREGRS